MAQQVDADSKKEYCTIEMDVDNSQLPHENEIQCYDEMTHFDALHDQANICSTAQADAT